MCFEDLATPRAVSVGSGLVTALGGGGGGRGTLGGAALSLSEGGAATTGAVTGQRHRSCHLDAISMPRRRAGPRSYAPTASPLRSCASTCTTSPRSGSCTCIRAPLEHTHARRQPRVYLDQYADQPRVCICIYCPITQVHFALLSCGGAAAGTSVGKACARTPPPHRPPSLVAHRFPCMGHPM